MNNSIPKGKLIIIVAPSGTGKSTLIVRLKNDFPELKESISYTTRSPRKGEIHGEQYFFISVDEFIKMRDQEQFLEWAEVHTNFYGTSKSFVEQKLNEGEALLFDIDVQGTDSFKTYFKDVAKAIFIAPPSIEVLKERLLTRGTDSDKVIDTRLENAKKEILRKDDFDFCVKNNDLEKAYTDLKRTVEEILRG